MSRVTENNALTHFWATNSVRCDESIVFMLQIEI